MHRERYVGFFHRQRSSRCYNDAENSLSFQPLWFRDMGQNCLISVLNLRRERCLQVQQRFFRLSGLIQKRLQHHRHPKECLVCIGKEESIELVAKRCPAFGNCCIILKTELDCGPDVVVDVLLLVFGSQACACNAGKLFDNIDFRSASNEQLEAALSGSRLAEGAGHNLQQRSSALGLALVDGIHDT